LLKHAKVYAGPDTAATHLAAAVGVPANEGNLSDTRQLMHASLTVASKISYV